MNGAMAEVQTTVGTDMMPNVNAENRREGVAICVTETSGILPIDESPIEARVTDQTLHEVTGRLLPSEPVRSEMLQCQGTAQGGMRLRTPIPRTRDSRSSLRIAEAAIGL